MDTTTNVTKGALATAMMASGAGIPLTALGGFTLGIGETAEDRYNMENKDDAFIENVESKDILCIVLDSDEVIDLKKVTDASRIINELLDKDEKLLESIYEVDIYSKEKGDE